MKMTRRLVKKELKLFFETVTIVGVGVLFGVWVIYLLAALTALMV